MTEPVDNTNRFFRGQMPDEEVMAFSRKHWIAIIPEVIPFIFFFSFVVLTLLLLKQIKLPSLSDPFFQMLVMVSMIGAGWLIHRFFLRIFRYFLNIVIITNYRIVEIKKTLFVRDTKESFDLRKVQEVEFRQVGLIKNLLKVGELEISMGNSEVKNLSRLPNPDFHFRLINRLKNEMFMRQQRPLTAVEGSYDSTPSGAPSVAPFAPLPASSPPASSSEKENREYTTRNMV